MNGAGEGALTPADVERIAEKVAEKASDAAIEKLLLRWGLEGAEDIKAFRTDLTYLRNRRMVSETVARHGTLAVVTMLLSGLGMALWAGIKGLLK